MKIKIYTDNRPNKQGLYQIRLSVSFMGRRLVTSLGTPMTKAEFDALNGDYLGTGYNRADCHPKHKELLKLLHAIGDSLDWELQKVGRGEISLSDVVLADVVNKCKGKQPKPHKAKISVKELYVKFVNEETKKKDLADRTQYRLLMALNPILRFDPNATISTMATYEWVHRYCDWNVGRGISNTTTKSLYTYLHWFLAWCYRNGYCGNDFERFRLELKLVDLKEKLVVFLTMDEIGRLQRLQLEGNLELTRDIFLFQCFTGLRISDVKKLCKSDIFDGHLHVVVQKTGVSLNNRLNEHALAIVEKYISIPGDTLFPSISTNQLDVNLRTIGKMAGIDDPVQKIDYRNHTREVIMVPKWQLMTTHVGRKSFVVNSLDLGLTATQVIAYTGHASITAMQPYISISQKKKDAAMDVWNMANATSENKNEIDEINAQIEALKKRLEGLNGSGG